ncbi:MAG: hypothetical protein C4576_03385 [Desulfobacteraceae bacterium]|nr:MAG: hypothetical protein C4576_03385 [Desulfobacteraceae bacterium]
MASFPIISRRVRAQTHLAQNEDTKDEWSNLYFHIKILILSRFRTSWRSREQSAYLTPVKYEEYSGASTETAVILFLW